MEDLSKVEEIRLEHPSKFPMSNIFISKGLYSWKNIEKQLFDVAISKPEKRYDPQTKKIKMIATVSVSELDALKYKGGGINYERAKQAADSLGKAFIRIEDKEHNRYAHVNVLERCTYDSGQYTLVFTDSIVSMGFVSPKKNYTTILQGVNVLSNSFSIRLYQNLKSKCFGKTDENGYYVWTVDVDRLKLLMGYINTEDEEFYKSEKENGLDSDDLHVVDVLKTKMVKSGHGRDMNPAVPYQNFSEFSRHALVPYVKEINEKMDIAVSYKKVQTKGHRIEKLKFFIKPNDDNKPSEDEIRKMLFMLSDIITARDIQWTASQLRELLAESGYNINIIREKYRLLLKQDPDKIRNRFGFMIDAIRYDYKDDAEENAVETDAEMKEADVFDQLWAVYKRRTRLDMITKKVRREIEAVGLSEMMKAISNYESVIEENRRNGFNRVRMSGGQFFSKGYRDYLPAVFDKMSDEEKGYIGNKNRFADNVERTSMDYEKLAHDEEMYKVLHGFD